MVVSQVEQRTDEKALGHPATYRAIKFLYAERTMKLSIRPTFYRTRPAELRVFFATWLISQSFLTSVRLWEERFRRHDNSTKQQRSHPSTVAVAVVVVTLGRSLYFLFLSFPTAS